jgi:4-hydroxy-4-methyl-2-oxoglutarate aldolase
VLIQPTPDELAAATPDNPFDRFPDGRPRVPDAVLQRLRRATTEQAWGVLRDAGYHHQFEGNWLETHAGHVIVGRAVTAQFVPLRPDYHEAVQVDGRKDGRGQTGGQNSWVIETLQAGDVMVVDIFGKVRDGTVIGDNLGTAVASRTGEGAVIHGGIRDLQGLVELEGVNFFVRGYDPTAIAEVTLTALNRPVRIGGATVLPGDIVLGTPTGVIFIPPHLAEAVADHADQVRVRDRFGKQRLAEGRYTSGQIDVGVWADDIEADFVAWSTSQTD